MMGWGYGYGGWDPFGFVWGIFWVVILICCLVFLMRWIRGERHHGRHHGSLSGDRSAMEILKERYAKGEIDRREFEEKKKDLEA